MARPKKKATRSRTPVRATPSIDVRNSARDIWLAGIGAMAVAEEESSKLFSTLVKKGSAYETKNRKRLDGALAGLDEMRGDAMTNLSNAGATLRRTAGRTIDRVESTIDSGVAAALERLGVPTRKEIHALTRKVERLTQTLETKARSKRRTSRSRTAAAVDDVIEAIAE